MLAMTELAVVALAVPDYRRSLIDTSSARAARWPSLLTVQIGITLVCVCVRLNVPAYKFLCSLLFRHKLGQLIFGFPWLGLRLLFPSSAGDQMPQDSRR